MKIEEHTPQCELEQLYEAVLRREFLRGTLLNLRQFLAFFLLLVLFPGMLLGFWGGMAVTAVFCVLLFTLLYMQMAEWGLVLAAIWVAIGLIELVVVTWGVFKRARAVRAQRRMLRSAEPGAARGLEFPMRKPLSWHKSDKAKAWKCSLVVEAPADGIYAFLLVLDACGAVRLGTDSPKGCCTVQTEGKPGTDFQALLLYKLAKGRHVLEWRMSAQGVNHKPTATITQLNRLS